MNKQDSQEKLNKLADAMYNVNRHISLKHIGMRKPMLEKDFIFLNRAVGEWIKQIREIAESLEDEK